MSAGIYDMTFIHLATELAHQVCLIWDRSGYIQGRVLADSNISGCFFWGVGFADLGWEWSELQYLG